MRMSDWCADVCSSDLLPPAQRLPATVGLAPQEGGFPALFGAVEEHRDQAGKIVEMRVFQLHASSLLGRMSSSVPLFGRRGGIVDRPGAGAARIGGAAPADRKSVVSGKSVSVRVDHGGRRFIKKNNKQYT